MRKISVTGAGGDRRVLALVRAEGRVRFACPINRYDEAMAGDDNWVVGFPAEDVEELAEPETRQ